MTAVQESLIADWTEAYMAAYGAPPPRPLVYERGRYRGQWVTFTGPEFRKATERLLGRVQN